MSKQSWKLVRISEELHTKLEDICKKRDSYGVLIQKLYDFYQEHYKKEGVDYDKYN